ncbi:hypothetical protein K470DRAFT_296919 [Piedraia hortae CBS 480.64]|uniref:Transcription initiation factor TFIID subunit 2 n=1 Tax=Piedraia hortae CBS 480.64 TaxID=1314780 RepID=A0A6A7BQZ7_9PEZI|nr:hypothetical protein K470DRAFT_296919 [Piedraia hortae CBS 480.64]
MAEHPEAEAPPVEYSVLRQRVDVDVDFYRQSLRGNTEITIQPHVKALQLVCLNCRQCTPTSVQAEGITANYEYKDPYRRLRMSDDSTVQQHGMLKQRIGDLTQLTAQPELTIYLPEKLSIETVGGEASQEVDAANAQFAPIKISIEFEAGNAGLHWVGCSQDDQRYPHVYTRVEPVPGALSSIFPCVDTHTSRYSWDICIHCPRTLGDAFRVGRWASSDGDMEMADADNPDYLINLTNEEAAMDLAVVCVGELTQETNDGEDETRHSLTFHLKEAVTARHVGFAIGPFERIDLSASRKADEEDRLGQSAIEVSGYCLPGRGDEVLNTCWAVTKALDYFCVNFGSFAFSSYKLVFLDDMVCDTVATAGVSFCSSRLLFPDKILEPIDTNPRILMHSLAEQWAGVLVIPKKPFDSWIVAGMAGYMADLHGKMIYGNNTYRWQQKQNADKVYEFDVERPSIYQHGSFLHIDHSIREFMTLKAALVLFILDRRLVKASGSSGCQRIVNRVFVQARTGSLDNGEISTAEFQRIAEKYGHVKLDYFFKQWVYGSGCPIFDISQRFNKKKLVVEMNIIQRQMDRKTKPPFTPDNFWREIKEHVQEVWAPETQPVFTGPMTIRIHEADGTPYEHIVEIKEQTTKLEIPYNTKYKRLKRSRRAKERAMAEGQSGEDALLYSLGDVLDSPEEMAAWQLHDWSAEDEDKMGQESYEWIRIDADFEWIGKIHLSMPLYMYISQLQQDRDLVAQYESVKWLMGATPHPMSMTILARTLMDKRYFHPIRALAAEGLAVLASNSVDSPSDDMFHVGQFQLLKAFDELFGTPGEVMPRPNDWTDRTDYLIQCAIPRAMVFLRDHEKKVPMTIRQFFIDKLRFNDNSENYFSDNHYIAQLMTCLSQSIIASHRKPSPTKPQTYTFKFGEEEDEMDSSDDEDIPPNPDTPIERDAISEIQRYRRLDEYNSTYQNIHTTTALRCLTDCTKAGLIPSEARQLLLYTRASNSSYVRIESFRCLNKLSETRKAEVMNYLLETFSSSPSPYFRTSMLTVLGEALGHIALDEIEKPSPAVGDVLVLDAAPADLPLAAALTGRNTPESALKKLQSTLLSSKPFARALWAATLSTQTLCEKSTLCDLAGLIFPSVSSLIVKMKLPKYWSCVRDTTGVKFTARLPVRIAPRRPVSREFLRVVEGYGLKYNGPGVSESVKLKLKRKNEDGEQGGRGKVAKQGVGSTGVGGAQQGHGGGGFAGYRHGCFAGYTCSAYSSRKISHRNAEIQRRVETTRFGREEGGGLRSRRV